MFKGAAVIASFVLVVLFGGRELGAFDSGPPTAQNARAGSLPPAADDDRLADRGRWVREAARICRRADEWFDRQPEPETPRELARWLARAVPKNRSVNAQILALRPPEGAEGKIRTLRALFAADERLLGEALAAARGHNWKAYAATVAKLERYYEREDKIQRRLGATPCTMDFGVSH